MEDQCNLVDDSPFSKLAGLLSDSQVSKNEIQQEVKTAVELAKDENIRFDLNSILCIT
jgi:hypothetical protein